MEKKITSPAVKGLIIALIVVVFSIVIYLADLSQNKMLGYLSMLIAFVGIIISCTTYSKEKMGNVTFGDLFVHGFKTTAAVAAIVALYTILACKVFFPEMIDKSMEIAKAEMVKQGKFSSAQIDQGMEIGRKFFLIMSLAGILIGYAILGVIGSLIGAAVAKKNPQANNIQTNM